MRCPRLSKLIDVGDEDTEVALEPNGGATLIGQLVPLAGELPDTIPIHLTGITPPQLSHGALTDAHGRFRVEGLAAGRYVVRAHRQFGTEYVLWAEGSAQVEADATAELTLELRRNDF